MIPARGGSQRIKGKNVRSFLGRPLIEYSIDAALTSGLFARVVVSTDSDELAEVSRRAGADVPFKRPPSLGDDTTPLAPVLVHALAALGGSERWDCVCCIYPTAPLLRAEDLRRGFAELGDADAALSVATFPYPIQRALETGLDGYLRFREPQYELTRSQDLPEAIHDAGQFVFLRSRALEQQRKLVPARTIGIPIPRERVQDIDTPEDWRVAEILFESLEAR